MVRLFSVITHHYSAFIGGRTLQILNAKEEDTGRYTCVATNEAGETLKHYEVKVYGEISASLKLYLSLPEKKR